MAAIDTARPRTLISRASLGRTGGRRTYWITLSAVLVLFTLVFLFAAASLYPVPLRDAPWAKLVPPA